MSKRFILVPFSNVLEPNSMPMVGWTLDKAGGTLGTSGDLGSLGGGKFCRFGGHQPLLF